MAVGRLIAFCSAGKSGLLASRDVPAGSAASCAGAACVRQEVRLGAGAANLSHLLSNLWSP